MVPLMYNADVVAASTDTAVKAGRCNGLIATVRCLGENAMGRWTQSGRRCPWAKAGQG